MHNSLLAHIRFILIVLLCYSNVVLAAPNCSDSLSPKPAQSNLSRKITSLLDLSIPYPDVPKDIITDINGNNLEAYLLAELFVLKYIYQRADIVQSPRIFFERLDHLELLSRLYEHPDIFARARSLTPDRTTVLPEVEILKPLAIITREAFFLTLLSLANRHPFFVLQNEHVVPLLAEVFFAPTKEIDDSNLPVGYQDLPKIRQKILSALQREKAALLRSSALRLSARTQVAIDKWNFWLKSVVAADLNKMQEVKALADKLEITLTPTKLPRGY